MKRFIFASLSILTLNVALVPATFAAETVRSESNFAEHSTTTFDNRDRASVDAEKSGAKPPSGDSNPSDLNNTTVNDREIINPQEKEGGKPPSGDSNPSDRTNSTVDGRDIINPQSK